MNYRNMKRTLVCVGMLIGILVIAHYVITPLIRVSFVEAFDENDTAPKVQTLDATQIMHKTATLRSTYDNNGGGAGRIWFEFRETGGNRNWLHAGTRTIQGDGLEHFSFNIIDGNKELEPGTEYEFRVMAENHFGDVQGSTRTFTTQSVATQLSGSCATNPTNPRVGQSVTFTANASGGTGNFTYSWSGEGVFGTSRTVTKTFTSIGSRTVNVAIQSGNQTINKTCTVNVTEDNQTSDFSVSCSANPATVEEDQNLRITANVTGGTGHTYSWSGSEGLHGSGQFVNWSYGNAGTKTATVAVISAGVTKTASCTIVVTGDTHQGQAPAVTTRPATNITHNSSELHAEVDANNGVGNMWFEYGTSATNLNQRTGNQAISGDMLQNFHATMTGLQPHTTYYFRAVAQTQYGLTPCDVLSFTTGNVPAPTQARLKIIKYVVNNDSGTRAVSDFHLFINGNRVNSGEWNTLTPGTYTVTEANLQGYTASTWGSDCSSGGVVTLSSGQDKVCTITNDDIHEDQQNALGGSCSVNPTSVLVGQSAVWSAQGTGGTGSYTYSWSGSDGLASTNRQATKVYTTAGTKVATVTITSGGNSVQRTCNMIVQDAQNQNLDGFCSSSAGVVYVGQGVTWSGQGTGGTGSYTYSWTGTDGLSSDNRTVSKTYNSPGIKTATVTISSGGNAIQKTCQVQVQNTQNPILTGACVLNINTAQINQNITFTAQANGGTGNYAYVWSGSDGTSGNGQTVTRSFTTAGDKTVTVNISSGDITIIQNCNVTVQAPNNQTPTLGGYCFVASAAVRVGETATFNAQGIGGAGANAYTYSWSGAEGNGQTATRVYSTTGQKTATVTITSGGNSVERTCNVNVIEVQTQTLDGYCIPNPYSIQTGGTITWTANPIGGSGNYTYSWNGTDGLSGSSQTASRSYSSGGTKTATVTITSGNSSVQRTCTANVQENSQDLGGSCTASNYNPQMNNSVTFTANPTGGEFPGGNSGNYTYSWSGDGISGSSQSISRSYGSGGTKTATVTIYSGNNSIQRTCNVYVQETSQNNLSVSCYATPSTADIHQNVTFYANANGGTGGYSYSWTGTDGLYGSGSQAYKSYDNSGTKYATVTVYSGGQNMQATCVTNIAQQNTSINAYCTANPTSANINENVTWSVYPSGGQGNYYNYTYSWSGTDGLYGGSQNVYRSYNTPGTKYATVTIYSGGNTITRTCSINVNNQNVIVYTNPGNNPYAGSVYLSQVPYTGVGSAMKVASFITMLLVWSAFVTYMIIRKRMQWQFAGGSFKDSFKRSVMEKITSFMPRRSPVTASIYKPEAKAEKNFEVKDDDPWRRIMGDKYQF